MVQDPDETAITAAVERKSLDNLPDDVALVLVELVKGWAEEARGSTEQRDQGKRLRDTTLKGVSLSCRRTFDFWYPFFLEDVTMGMRHINSFLLLLKGRNGYGRMIKSIDFDYRRADMNRSQEQEMMGQMVAASRLDDTVKDQARFAIGFGACVDIVYEELQNLEKLIIEDSYFNLPFEREVRNGNIVSRLPLKFLTNSLKKLFMPLPMRGYAMNNLNGRNIIWILVFCVHLREVALGCSILIADKRFTKEFQETFSRKSKVRKLALNFRYDYDDADPKTFWGKGNAKNTAISTLLQVTDQLECLELFPSPPRQDKVNPGDYTHVDTGCLSSLTSSFETLKHLRMLNFPTNKTHPTSTDYSKFRSLKVLTMDRETLICLHDNYRIPRPKTIENFILPFYGRHKNYERSDEGVIAGVFGEGGEQSWPKLKEIIIPSASLTDAGHLDASHQDKTAREEGRKWLLKDQLFASGKVKLIKSRFGEGGELSKDWRFMSNLRWPSQ